MDDSRLLERITRAVADCYIAGDYSHVDYEEIAPYSLRRWRSSIRRRVPQNDIERRIYDLAKGLTSQGLHGRRGTVLDSHVVLARAIAAVIQATDEG